MDENSSSFDEQLLEAYRLTRYCLDQPPLFLRIDAPHPALDQFLESRVFNRWAYLR